MKSPKISIIVPVFKVEIYLKKCLESLVNQTLLEIEIICVNDGSPDKSQEIIESYAKRDSRIKLLNQRNTGASGARNNGVKNASGKYLMFVDADDWLELDACEILYNFAENHKADVVMYSCMLEYENKTLNKFAFDHDWAVYLNEGCKMLHRRHFGMVGDELAHPEKQDFLCSACTKLYKREIVVNNNIEFPDIKEIGSYEDGMFNLYYFGYINKACYSDKLLYHYRKSNEDSNTSNFKPDLPKKWERLFALMEEYIEKNQPTEEFKQAVQNRRALSIIGLGLNIASAKISYFEKLRRVKRILSKPQYRQAVKQLTTKYMPIYWKLFFTFAKINNAFAVYMLLAVMNKLRGRV